MYPFGEEEMSIQTHHPFFKSGISVFVLLSCKCSYILATGRIADTQLTVSPSPGLPILSVVSFTVKRFLL